MTMKTLVGAASLLGLFASNLCAQSFRVERTMQLRKNSGLHMSQTVAGDTLVYTDDKQAKHDWYRFVDRNNNQKAERLEMVDAGLYVQKPRDAAGRAAVQKLTLQKDGTAQAMSGYLDAGHLYVEQGKAAVREKDARTIIGRPLRSAL